jgi:hypothetical protein
MQVIFHKLHVLKKALGIKFFRKADLQRWADLHNYNEEWDRRTEIIGSLIPKKSHVIDFGAGRRRLEAYIDPSCTYFPADLVSRGPGTIICNLNERPLPNLQNLKLDVAVFGGVLEYIADLHSIPPWLATFTPVCIASYNCAYSPPNTLKRIRDSLARMDLGWVNSFDEKELEAIFVASGFSCRHKHMRKTKSGEEHIFVFEKVNAHATDISENSGGGSGKNGWDAP